MGGGPDSVQLLHSTKLIFNITHISPTVYCVVIILLPFSIFSVCTEYSPHYICSLKEKSKKKIVSVVGTSLESRPEGNVMGMQKVLIIINNCINNQVCFLYTLRATVAL